MVDGRAASPASTVTATLCLCDDPQVTDAAAHHVLSRFVELAVSQDRQITWSLMKSAAEELAQSRWGAAAARMTLREIKKLSGQTPVLLTSIYGTIILKAVPISTKATS